MYQRRENLQFYGTHEETPDENNTAILYTFLETKLEMSNALNIETFNECIELGNGNKV